MAIAPVAALTLGSELVPTAGSWQRDGRTARFVPRFPAVPGTVFAVLGRVDAAAGWAELARLVAPGLRAVPTASVELIDPQCAEVPANLLRLAITFSAPMELGSAAGQIRLRDERGAELPGTLLDMPPELWSRDRRRLTVLLEPGRIKRGLQPNVQAGPPLREGERVTVVVGAGIRDAEGAELVDAAERSYRIGPPVRARVDTALWRVRWPERAGDPLVVRFDRALDRALVRSCLRVVDGDAQTVPGRASLDDTATLWTFSPSGAPVDLVHLALRIDTRLEDLAGNSVRRVFDRDLSQPDDGVDTSEVMLRAR